MKTKNTFNVILMADLKRNIIVRISAFSNVGRRMSQDKKFTKKEKLKFGGFDDIIPKIKNLELMEIVDLNTWVNQGMKNAIHSITLTEYLLNAS